MKTYCTYLRVSTQRQGAQGLGISAQRTMCENFIKQNNGEHVKEFMDVESGTHRDRKGLWDAIDFCKANDCSLVIAKLDRLARDVEFTFKVINTGIDIHFTDMPVVNSMVLGVFASVAQYEREMCSTRTKQALAVKKEQGARLGAANEAYRASYEAKTRAERAEIGEKRGKTHNAAYLASRDTQAFVRILRRVFGEVVCPTEDVSKWSAWKDINTKADNKGKILALMRDYQAMDGGVFKKWNLSGSNDKQLQSKLSNAIYVLRRAARTAKMYNEKQA